MALPKPSIPKWAIYALVIMVPTSWVPLAMVAYYRAIPHRQPRIHIFQDMDNQPRLNTQAASATFADRRAMRPPVVGTVSRGHLQADDAYDQGKVRVDGKWEYVTEYPGQVTVDGVLLSRGRQRFDIYCAPCHGASGYGDGMVHQRARELGATAWIQPTNLHTDDLRGRPLGDLYNVIRWGRRNMAAYGSQIPTDDRWAIVAYVKALQLSQHAATEDVPADKRAQLRQE